MIANADANLTARNIDGAVYEFSKFGAKQSLQIFFKLANIVGEPMAVAFGAVDGTATTKLLDRDLNVASMGKAIQALTARLDSPDTLILIEKLTSTPALLCDGKPVLFDKHYEGRLDHLMKVLQAALEVQYGNFFDALSSFLPQTKPGSTKQPSNPPA